MKLPKAIPLALAWNRLGWRHMGSRAHVRVSGDPVKLTVTIPDGLLEVQTDHPGVGDFYVAPKSLRKFGLKDRLSVIDGRLHKINGLSIPLGMAESVDDLPVADTTGFTLLGEIPNFSRKWNLACNHAAVDPSRYAITNVAILPGMDIVATNGEVLYTTTAVGDTSKAVLVPIDVARFIGRVDGDLAVFVKKDEGKDIWVRLEVADSKQTHVLVISRLSEGQFPDILRSFSPSTIDVQFRVQTDVWTEAWKAVKAHPNSDAMGTRCGIVDIRDGGVTIRPPQRDDITASIKIPVEVLGDVRRTFLMSCDYALTSIPGDKIEVYVHNVPDESLKGTDGLWKGPVRISGDLGQCLVMTLSLKDCQDKDIKARFTAAKEKVAVE